VIRRLAQVVRDEWQIRQDPVAYARREGVTVADDCWLAGLVRGSFGTEPYLITIGERCAVASGVRFITHDGASYLFRREFPSIDIVGRITLGDDVMIGMNAILLPDTEIGDYSIIGAGAVVSGQVPPGSVYAGVPARRICSTEEYRAKVLPRGIHVAHLPAEEKRELFIAFLDGKVDGQGNPIEAPADRGT
jgi:acetyltransferase-like isoleucine patch superfamily enzyme